jgi:hypothetical protein
MGNDIIALATAKLLWEVFGEAVNIVDIPAFCSRYYFTVRIGGYRDNNGHKPAPGPGRVRRL